MLLDSIGYLLYFLFGIIGLFVIIGLIALCWMGIVELIKFHNKRMKAIAQANQANQPLIETHV
jgi:hypothetical protein